MDRELLASLSEEMTRDMPKQELTKEQLKEVTEELRKKLDEEKVEGLAEEEFNQLKERWVDLSTTAKAMEERLAPFVADLENDLVKEQEAARRDDEECMAELVGRSWPRRDSRLVWSGLV